MNKHFETKPKISVVMAVHNGAAYLDQSIRSILTQTFFDFEFIIIDDGSTDETGTILDRFENADRRIRVFHENKEGLCPSLNKGCNLARGEYIARMDADDISLPMRFARQCRFLDGHPDVAMCGSWVKKIGRSIGNVWRFPAESDVISCRMLFANPVAHPTAMIRKSALSEIGFYDEDCLCTEDYACWAKLVEKRKIANIPEVLLKYRIHSSQKGRSDSDEIRKREYKRIQALQLRRLGLSPTAVDMDVHYLLSVARIATTSVHPNLELMKSAGEWLLRIRQSNERTQIYSEHALLSTLALYWYFFCRSCTAVGPGAWDIYRRSWLCRGGSVNGLQKAAFIAKSVLRYDVNNRQYFLKVGDKLFSFREKLRGRK
jgi:glycosyltransferase involved in cell wall biosynthesis